MSVQAFNDMASTMFLTLKVLPPSWSRRAEKSVSQTLTTFSSSQDGSVRFPLFLPWLASVCSQRYSSVHWIWTPIGFVLTNWDTDQMMSTDQEPLHLSCWILFQKVKCLKQLSVWENKNCIILGNAILSDAFVNRPDHNFFQGKIKLKRMFHEKKRKKRQFFNKISWFSRYL
jgi:hypothetical protein